MTKSNKYWMIKEEMGFSGEIEGQLDVEWRGSR